MGNQPISTYLIHPSEIVGVLANVPDQPPNQPKAEKTLRRLLSTRTNGTALAMTLDEVIQGFNVEKFVESVSPEKMVRDLYLRLVPVHELERGLLPIMYSMNQPFFEDNQPTQNGSGLYHSPDIITTWSCAGHLPGEPHAGKHAETRKMPSIGVLDRTDIRPDKAKEYALLMRYLIEKGFTVGTSYVAPQLSPKGNQISLRGFKSGGTDREFIDSIRQYWRDIIDVLNLFNPNIQIDPAMVDAIRPAYQTVR